MPSRAEEMAKANKWFRENLPEIVALLKEAMEPKPEPKKGKS